MKLNSSTSLKSNEITSSNNKNNYNDSVNVSNPNTPVPSPSMALNVANSTNSNTQKINNKPVTSASTSGASLKQPVNESAFKSTGNTSTPSGLTTPKQNTKNLNLNSSNPQMKGNKNTGQSENLIG